MLYDDSSARFDLELGDRPSTGSTRLYTLRTALELVRRQLQTDVPQLPQSIQRRFDRASRSLQIGRISLILTCLVFNFAHRG